ncbi:radical SAM protein [Paenibacillus melissococcoides]|uniref:Heme chaperone HemW n=2 Tax=Paenibacillus TaxID=44249 RepID=A0ABM9GE45_9BACL|nr:radical SAM protein [Paenibacillus melissococcoides]MEB9895029.1 radical SAM protein [Bacillus cereus]CAH8249551.1 radical SAM protein [Paenibacillus melissococcoides]CAH8721087.1 radical SAM protein [Paenibacillus melissococcoides]
MFKKKETEHYDYPQVCIFQDTHDENRFRSYLQNERMYNNETSIYIHVPYCKSICVFCNYFKLIWGTTSEEEVEAYVSSVEQEIEYYGSRLPERLKRISGIQFGGGTPTILPEHYMKRILEALRKNFDLSKCSLVSIEGTMDSLIIDDFECVSRLACMGFNRVSFGVQTFTPELRRKYGLVGKIEKFEELCAEFHKTGLTDFNIDLMYNYPEQNPEDVIQNIDKAFELGVTAIDLYSLNVFPETKLYHRYKQRGLWDDFINPEKENAYQMIYQFLKSRDDIHAIMGNTISKRRTAPHNTLSIQLGNNRDYGGSTIGIGPSSRGIIDGYVYKNYADMEKYVNGVKEKGNGISVSQEVSQEEMENRTIVMFPNFMHLNKNEAAALERHREKIDQLIEAGMLIETKDQLVIPKEHGYWVGNMSSMFYSTMQTKKMIKSYFQTRKHGFNLYNQDQMQVKKNEIVNTKGVGN